MKDGVKERAPRAGRRVGEPAYLRIVNALTSRIAHGVYRPGGQLPTEAQLRREFGVSPMTVRRAIGILLDRGLVSTTPGKGTFVRSLDLGEAVFRLQEVTDQWATGDSVHVRLLEASIAAATKNVADVLRISPGARTVYLRRLLLRDGMPIVYHREHVVYDETRPLVEAQLQITSLEGLLRGAAGAGLPSGDLSIQAVSLGLRAAEQLGVPRGAPAFCLEHVFSDFDGAPVSWGWFLCRADQFRLSTHLGPVSEDHAGDDTGGDRDGT
ncbi:MAG: GntR family transcriptional regulator [Thermoleophilia bacterium]